MAPQEFPLYRISPAGYSRASDGESCDPGTPSETVRDAITTPEQPNWVLEIAALLICLSTVAGTAVLLFLANDQPLADYTFVLPFNAIVSILATVARVSLCFSLGSCLGQWKWNWFRRRPDSLAVFESFEDASRGPWGSLTLVAKFQVRHWAALGAFLTVVMLGFEPFVQSTIQYNGDVRVSHRNESEVAPPTLSRSEISDAGVYRTDGTTAMQSAKLPSGEIIPIHSFFSQPDLGMTAAVYNGFTERFSTSQQTALYSCTTGNCTWPIFTTLSMCSRCNDVTDYLKKEALRGDNLGTIRYDGVYMNQQSYVAYSLPYINISNLADKRSDGNQRGPLRLSAFMTAKTIHNQGRTLTFTQFDTMITAIGIIKADAAYVDGRVNWGDSVVTATECALYFCANAYNTSVENGVLKEDTIGSWAIRVPGTYQWTIEPPPWYDEAESVRNQSIVSSPDWSKDDIGGDVERSDLQLRIPLEEAKASEFPGDTTLVFNITQNTVGSMARFLNFDFFQTKSHDRMVWPIIGKGGFQQAPVAQSLWDSPDLSDTFSNVALALSNWLRDSSNTTHFGTTKEYIVYIQVDWVYLTIPVVVVTAGCVFILLSIWETKCLGLPAWRSSVISTLSHSLDADLRSSLRRAERNGNLKTEAKEAVVYLDNASDGPELKAHIE